MNEKTLYLGWRDKERRQWFPVGRLDADVDLSRYRFRYTAGAKRAEKEVGFPPLYDFPDMDRDYQSSELFALFKNRIIAQGRPDRTEYLDQLDLPENANPVQILSVNGGHRVTDFYEVFPRVEKDTEGNFTCRFLLHGLQNANPSALEKIGELKERDELHVALEWANLVARWAVQIQTKDYHTIGWVPRYLMGDIVAAMTEATTYSAHVVKVNPQPAPLSQRVLIEMSGCWIAHEPMSSEDFLPLVA